MTMSGTFVNLYCPAFDRARLPVAMQLFLVALVSRLVPNLPAWLYIATTAIFSILILRLVGLSVIRDWRTAAFAVVVAVVLNAAIHLAAVAAAPWMPWALFAGR
jgi:hypothetical protein